MIATSGFPTDLECKKFVFGRGSAPDPAGEFTVLPRPSSWFKGALLLRWRVVEGKEGRGEAGMGKGRGSVGET